MPGLTFDEPNGAPDNTDAQYDPNAPKPDETLAPGNNVEPKPPVETNAERRADQAFKGPTSAERADGSNAADVGNQGDESGMSDEQRLKSTGVVPELEAARKENEDLKQQLAQARNEVGTLNEQITGLNQRIETFTEPTQDEPPTTPYPEPAPRNFATPEAEIDHLKGQAEAKLGEAHGFIQRIETLLHNRAPSAIFAAFHRATDGMKHFLSEL